MKCPHCSHESGLDTQDSKLDPEFTAWNVYGAVGRLLNEKDKPLEYQSGNAYGCPKCLMVFVQPSGES